MSEVKDPVCKECGEPEDEDGNCQNCCDHEFDVNEGGMCINCGKEGY